MESCCLRTPHAASGCPFKGCRTCRAPQRRQRRRPPPAAAPAQRRSRFTASVERKTDPLQQRLQALSLEDDSADVPSWLQPAPLEDHTGLKHGMSCALCRNNYWTGGRPFETIFSHL